MCVACVACVGLFTWFSFCVTHNVRTSGVYVLSVRRALCNNIYVVHTAHVRFAIFVFSISFMFCTRRVCGMCRHAVGLLRGCS